MASQSLRICLFAILLVGLLSAGFHGLGLIKGAPWHIVYSDTLGFYQRISAPGLPYLNKSIEYPVITGFFIQLMATLGQTRAGYYILTSLFLILFAALTTYFLYQIIPEQNRKRLWQFWIFAPSMLIFLTYNWDIIALLFVILAFYFMQKDKDLWAAFFLALGFCSKFYPIIYLLPLILKNHSNVLKNVRIIGIFLLTAIIINLPFIFLNFNGWSYFYALNQLRNSNPDSIWTIARYFFRGLNVPTINLLSFLFFGLSYGAVIWKFKKANTLFLCFAATLLFLIFNKVFSPQYLLWLLPFFVLLPSSNLPRWTTAWFYALEFSNLAAFFIILPWFLISKDIAYFYYAAPFVLIRHIALISILFLTLKSLNLWKSDFLNLDVNK